MGVGRSSTVVCIASLVAACSAANPEFDPPRRTDTDSLPPDDDGGTTTGAPAETGEDTTPVDDTGSVGPLCNDMPEEEVAFRMFQANGNPVQRCGTLTERDCFLTRNEVEARWELSDCCIGDLCDSAPTYVLEFAPTGPDVSLGEMSVSIRFAFSPDDQGCKLEWLEIDERSSPPDGVHPLVYMAATNLGANEFVSVPAAPGEPLPDEVCECTEADADCCPEGLGRHQLEVSPQTGPVTLDPTDPTQVLPIESTELATEVSLVRAWQPPVCDAPPQYQWIARRYWL